MIARLTSLALAATLALAACGEQPSSKTKDGKLPTFADVQASMPKPPPKQIKGVCAQPLKLLMGDYVLSIQSIARATGPPTISAGHRAALMFAQSLNLLPLGSFPPKLGA